MSHKKSYMGTNLAIDPYSLEQGIQVSGERMKKVDTTKVKVPQEFVARREQQRAADLFGKFE